jgi:hypothetical protein
MALGLLAPACAGGGGGGEAVGSGVPAGDPPAPPAPTAEERARAILEGCGLETITAFEAVASRFDGTIDGEGDPTPDFSVTGIDFLGASIAWTLDAEADGQVDLEGTMRFLDPAGTPTFPFSIPTLLEVLAGNADLVGLLATIPDGTRVVVDYAAIGSPVPVSGTFDTTFAGGTASTTSGRAEYDGAGCDTGISFEGLAAAALLSENPTGAVDFLTAASGGTLEGSVTLNGDGTATIEGWLDGADPVAFTYDLATGTLTPLP